MRPLHRPMFRYGGPIKEGVMSGIREPHAGGGRAALVGNPVYPRTGGREHHNILKTIFGWGAKPALGVGAKEATKKTVGTEATKGIKSLWQKYGPDFRLGRNIKKPPNIKSAPHIKESIYTTKGVPFMEKAGRFVRKNPWWTAAGVAGPGQTALVKGVQEGPGLLKRGVMQIGDLLVHDSIFDQDKYFADKEKAKLDEEKKLTANELRIKELEKLLAGKDEPEVPQKTEEEIRNERIQKYRDIMDIKGMNKEAAYKSLIDASKLVSESGDFKGDIKSGKLINQVIQAASKQFEKPKKTKDAIDTLILKGEIEADIAARKGSTSWQQIEALSKASGQSPKFVANAKLGIANTISEAVNNFRKIKKLPTSDDITGVVYSFSERTGVPVKKQISTEKASEVIGKGKKYETVTDMISDLDLDPSGADDGFYVVGTKVVQVTDGVPRIKA